MKPVLICEVLKIYNMLLILAAKIKRLYPRYYLFFNVFRKR